MPPNPARGAGRVQDRLGIATRAGACGTLDRVSLTQLRYFVAVAEERHFTRAAKRLAVSQPPLSRSIRALEEEVGADLLRRTPRGAELTPSGAVLLSRARTILAEVEGAAAAARAAVSASAPPSPPAAPTRRTAPR
jgi:DNA-binding transcriptional LysR family regulator